METIGAELVDTGAKRDGRGRRLAVREEAPTALATYECSGLAQREFAKHAGIEFHTFTRWLKRYHQPGGKLAFAQVRVALKVIMGGRRPAVYSQSTSFAL